MDRRELIRRARRIEMRSRRLVAGAMAGEYRSVFRGTGVEFESVREYAYGDDVRAIDWNVTARLGRPFVKRFRESRERAVWFVVDRSASMDFGSGDVRKIDRAIEVVCVLALAAERNRDPVGLLQHTERLESFLPPRTGPEAFHRTVTELLSLEPRGRGFDPDAALDALMRRTRRRGLVFLVGDFARLPERGALRRLARRHETVALRVVDPRERDLAGVGRLAARDPETGAPFQVALNKGGVRKRYASASSAHAERVRREVRASGADLVEVGTDEDPDRPLLRFFARRERRRIH